MRPGLTCSPGVCFSLVSLGISTNYSQPDGWSYFIIIIGNNIKAEELA